MVRRSDMKLPLVSVITPSFNQGRFIEKNILSVKNQSYSRIEHIILDGGSTDDTLEILKRHENSYDMKWFSEPDQGQADAVNKGFAQAKGEIIGWLNSDDVYYDLDTLEFIAASFCENRKIHVLYGDTVLIGETNLILRVECKPSFKYSRLLRGCFIIQPSVFFRKSVVDQEKLNINLNFAMDYEYWLRIGRKYHFHHVDRILSADRYHPVRKIIVQRDSMKKERFNVMEEYGQSFGVSYFLMRFFDKILSGWLRVKGLKRLYQIESKSNLAFDARIGSILAGAYRQLIARNRNLADMR